MEKHAPEEVLDAFSKRQSDQWIGPKHAPNAALPSYDTVQTSDRVSEEHVYLFRRLPNGDDEVWEADLIGDLSPDQGHGKLPPLIHMECPFCTNPPDDRRALTIDKMNKGYEVEPVEPFVKTWYTPTGRVVSVGVECFLNVRESLRCPYCQTRFTIRGSRIEVVK